jgi:hypothetical protein
MPFPKGVKPRGSGRKLGSKSKRTLEIARNVALTGKTPLEVMLECMRSYLEAGNFDKAAAFANDAAPYVHPAWRASKSAANPVRRPSKQGTCQRSNWRVGLPLFSTKRLVSR